MLLCSSTRNFEKNLKEKRKEKREAEAGWGMGAEIKYLSWSLFHPPSGISKTNRNASSHSSVAAEQGYKKAKHHRQNTSLSVTQKEVSHTYKHKPLARPFITLVLVIFWLKEF